MSESVIKLHVCTIQMNSKTKITDDLFTKYKSDIEQAWSGMTQKISKVSRGGGKNIFVTFENKKQAVEAYKKIVDEKIKYWDTMSTAFMINFNV